jgi:hypothetical protein
MRRRAERHRNWRYGKVASLQAEFEAAVQQHRWAAILRLLRCGWFEPVSDEDLFELYCLTVILDVLANELEFGEPVAYGLIRRNRKEVARFQREEDGVSAAVFFNQSPSNFANIPSEYMATVKAHGVRGASHRPDICVRFSAKPDENRFLLLEMKKSQDLNYMRDSVYKALGYLRDFSELWAHVPDQHPKAIVLFPRDSSLVESKHEGEVDLVLASARNRNLLASLLTTCNVSHAVG